jgi:NIMA (never in mitosis gene a)-related kinase
MENADGGDLYNKILTYKKKSQFIPEKEIWHYFIQMVRGLSALHDLKIVHRDIKCANIFLTKDGVLKLGDLNVSKVAKRGML